MKGQRSQALENKTGLPEIEPQADFKTEVDRPVLPYRPVWAAVVERILHPGLDIYADCRCKIELCSCCRTDRPLERLHGDIIF